MGYIKKLKNNELVGGTDKHTIYPVTSTKAVFEEVTEGNESSFKSQKTINKEQQDELDDHEERIQAAEAEDIKSITINGSTKKFEVDDENNVDLTIYTVDSDPDMPGIADNVRDLRNMVGTSTPVLETSHKTRIENLETTVGTGGSVDQRISDAVTDEKNRAQDIEEGLQTQVNALEIGKQKTLSVGTGITLTQDGVISATADPSVAKVVEALPTGDAIIDGLIYLVKTGTAGTYSQHVHSTSGWSDDLPDISLGITTDNAIDSTSTNPIQNNAITAQIGYFVCSASGSSAIKNVDAPSYSPSDVGGAFKIKMNNTNTCSDTVYLQFNSDASTKKELRYNREPVTSTNTWDSTGDNKEVISVYYDGTCYQASNAQGGGGKAEKIKYDNSESGLAAENVQGALDEISKVIINEEGIAPTISVAKVISGNNVWESFSGMNGEFVPVVHGKNYRIVVDSSNSGIIAFMTRATQSGVYYAGGATSRTVLSASSDVMLTAPDDANYLYYTQIGTTPATVRVYEVGTIQDDIDNIYSRVGALEEDSTAPIEDEIDLSTKIAAGNYGFWGGIWRANTQHSGWFIPISGESIRVVAGNGIVYCMFCSGTTQTANTASSYVSGPFLIQSGDALTDDIPENATYLWCNINTYDKRVLPSEVYCTRRYGLNRYSQKIEPKISYLSSKVGTIEDIGNTIGNNDTLVRTFKGIVFYNKDDNELYIRSLTTGTWIYKDIECLRNPIIEDGSPDASIIIAGGAYYVFTTSDIIFRSTDFVHWERLPYKTVPESYTGSQWAPDVNYLSNKYVIYLTYNGNSLLVLSSDTILNEDRYTVEAELNLGSIDYCYYNGYLFYGSGTVYRRTMTDYKTPADDAVTLSGPSGEGPMLWHNGDYYYMFTSTPLSQTYQYDVKVYRASSLTATTWENGGKILGSASSSEILNGPGHVSEVLQDADGRYFMMMQIHIYNSGWTYRPTIIQEFRMNSNGWPEFIDATGNVITKPSIMCRKPKLPLTVLK